MRNSASYRNSASLSEVFCVTACAGTAGWLCTAYACSCPGPVATQALGWYATIGCLSLCGYCAKIGAANDNQSTLFQPLVQSMADRNLPTNQQVEKTNSPDGDTSVSAESKGTFTSK